MPKNLTSICSPFFGGGALELSLANEGVRVYGYDSFSSLVDFWQVVINSPIELADEVEKYFPICKEEFYHLQKKHTTMTSKLERAASFYVLNRASFSGSTLSGGMSPKHPRFTLSSIKRLRDFKARNISVDCMSFEESIMNHEDEFLYCDPPYYIDNYLYGNKGDAHKNFNHQKLAEILKGRNNWILSYNNCDYIKELYKGYEFVYPEWSYGMSKNKESKEILIISK